MMPELSIITPVLQGKNHIEACIQNVMQQNCPDLEHIIIDGASTDGTTEVMERYAANYPHIRWISEKDRGQSDAMNKGVALARGSILGVLNVDDYYEPGVLNRIRGLFATLSEPGLLIGNCNVRDNRGDLLYLNRPVTLRIEDLMVWKKNVFPVNPSAYFYHKSLHQAIGNYDLQEAYAMDIDFLFRALQAAHLKYVDETLGNYVFRKGTKTYEDTVAGQTPLRLKRLIRKYRRNLPLRARLRVDLRNSRCWAEAELHQLYLGYCRLRERVTGK